MIAPAVRPSAAGIVRPAVIVAGLMVMVWLRWLATVGGVAGAIAIGLVFGIGLLGVAAIGGWRPVAERRSSVVVGIVGGGVLVALALTTRTAALPAEPPAAAFVPWAAVTILVASAEEIVLRGVLFDALDVGQGTVTAVVATSLVFSLMHVPLYGWQVAPLDLGVGLWLAGLRLATGGIVAPAAAHAIADLATWWL